MKNKWLSTMIAACTGGAGVVSIVNHESAVAFVCGWAFGIWMLNAAVDWTRDV